ncbi:MAG: hypothetical protein ABH863_06215 [Candidatus Micrarchaeota archaeon]
MHEVGNAEVKMDKVGRVLIPSGLRKGMGTQFNIVRMDDKLILRERRHGTFKKCFDSLKLTNEDLENMEQIIAEGGAMGNYE